MDDTESDEQRSPGAARLAEAMIARRDELHLSQMRASERAWISPDRHISEQTWGAVERLERKDRRHETLIAIERALDWPRGTTTRLLRNEDDVPIHHVHREPDADAEDEERPGPVSSPTSLPANASPTALYALGRLEQISAELETLRQLLLRDGM